MTSLDPRINRIQLNETGEFAFQEHQCFGTYEVFHQAKTGEAYVHVGSVHAPTKELALVFAKEQYGRRMKTTGMWITPTSAILAFDEEDTDMFATTPEKLHREPVEYKVRHKIEEYKARKNG